MIRVVIATGVGGLRNNTVFADIDGDGPADYLDVTREWNGAVEWWYNQEGPDNGPNAAKVGWWDRGSITGGDGTSGANVMFADVSAMGGQSIWRLIQTRQQSQHTITGAQ
ncbi:hypothetical protein LTR56_022910 [Elasticomyces elasticus]|nr:hypothetical protein LTR56_022910 [Elasticomyces elasticus]KAK3626932.1 hypothetical protein LTR22_022967 [Elasticomyces elasticus]KAK4907544.1 hypothetical protein LTR49_023448 [Elasticomyces elasticus]